MTALPSLPEVFSESPMIRSAYTSCLRYEISAKKDPNRLALIYARILGYLILHAPSDRAREAIAREIMTCHDDESSLAISGKTYFDHFIYPFKRNSGPIPAIYISPSPSPSPTPGFDTCEEMITDMYVEAPKSRREVKHNALIRDGFRCVVTGNYDRTSAQRNRELYKRVHDEEIVFCGTKSARIIVDPGMVASLTHVFAEATNRDISGSDEPEHATSLWTVMNQLGYEQVTADLNGDKIHSLQNVLTCVNTFSIREFKHLVRTHGLSTCQYRSCDGSTI